MRRASSRCKNIYVAGCELVEHHVAARVSEDRELLRERLVFAQCRGRNPGPFSVAKENLDSIGNRDGLPLRFFSRFRQGLNDGLAIPGISRFPCRYKSLCFVPIGARLLAVEFSAECPRHMNEASAFLPASAPLLEFA